MLGGGLQMWSVAWACLWVARVVLADEEDPLQHEAQVAARDRQLTRVLQLLGVEQAAPDHDRLDGGGHKDDDDSGRSSTTDVCTHTSLKVAVPPDKLDKFQDGLRAALHVANLLNNLFVAVPGGLDPTYPPHVFYALVRAVVENEPTITSSAVAFLRGEFRVPVDPKSTEEAEGADHREMFGSYAFRRDSEIATANLAALYNQSFDKPDEEGARWFTSHLNYRSVPYCVTNSSG